MAMRLYQTEEDMIREERFLSKILKRFKCEAIQLPIEKVIDRVLVRPFVDKLIAKPIKTIVAFAELKCRNVESDRYPTTILSEKKLQWVAHNFKNFGLYETAAEIPLMFFVRFKDKDKFVKVRPGGSYKREYLKLAHRKDDPTSSEWVIHIPREDFKEF